MSKTTRVALTLLAVFTLSACENKVNNPAQTGAQAQAPDKAAEADANKAPSAEEQGAAKAPTMEAPKAAADDPFAAPADVAAPPADAPKSEGGVWSKVLKAGSEDKKPAETDIVEVHYTGWTTDGKMFDSSVQRGQSIKFPLNAVIPGWREGVKLMSIGEKRRIWIPEELAYKGQMGAPQGMLVFDIELLKIITPPKIETPEDVAAPPKSATLQKSGIHSRVLTKGTGKAHPTDASMVKVHYSGWTTDGKMFDSSVQRGEPTSFPLGRVIPGWREAVKLMVVGEKSRFWIPEEMAYKGVPGAPQGMLVFDIELLEINEPTGAGPAGHGAHDGHGH